MALIKKCDVKIHLSLRRRKGSHPAQRIEKPAPTILSETDAAIESDVQVFADVFSLEHSSPGRTVSAVMIAPSAEDMRLPRMQNTPIL